MSAVMRFEEINARTFRTAAELNAALVEMARLLPEMIDDVLRNMIEQLYISLAGAGTPTTPIKTGRARTGWTIGTEPTEWAPPDMSRDMKSASEVLAAARTTLSSLPRASAYYLCNNVPYILELERGTSKQAPQGFIALALTSFRMAAEKQAAEWSRS